MRRSLTLTLLVLFGCQSTPEVKPVSPASPALLFSMERGPCFGACPVYRVEVFSDGLLRFKGERFVKVTEAVEETLSPAQLAALTARLERADFKWADYTQRNATDLPTVRLTHGARALTHYHGDASAPGALQQLEDDLDALLGTQRWISGAGGAAQ